jgi:hypothetical protein
VTLENLIIGAITLEEWFGRDLQGVPKEVAERRASICSQCPKNRTERWMDRWPVYASNLFRIRNTMRERGMVTTKDLALNVCSVCDCPLKLKVYCPLDIIKKHMPSDVIARLDPSCWITKPE